MSAIFLLYLWFVLDAGPKLMAQRSPVDLTKIIRAYNIFQVIVCSVFVIGGYSLGFTYSYLFKCERFDFFSESTKRVVQFGVWLFLCLRMIELCETVFFILRKKENQASFLHIFHHISSATMAWLFIAMRAGKSYFISSSLSLTFSDLSRVLGNLRRNNEFFRTRDNVFLLFL